MPVREGYLTMFESISDKLQVVFKKLKGRGKLTESNIKEGLREVRLALLEADVNYRVVKEFIESVRERALGQEVIGSLMPGQQVIKIVHEEMVKLMGPAEIELNLDKKPSVIMLVGLQGCGKTTMCAKLALLFKKKDRRVIAIPCDSRRPAAAAQLRELGRKAGVEVYNADGDKEPIEIARAGVSEAKSRGFDIALVDTGGRLHVDDELMKELEEFKRQIVPQEILLVVDAMTGQDAVKEAVEFEKRLNIDGVILTKLDGDARGGAALSVRKVTGKPIKFAGVGEKVDAIESFFPDRIASRILGMGDVLTLIEKVETLVDEKERKKWERKIAGETFTLEDLLAQLRLTKKMGSLQELAQMIPGGRKLQGAAVDENRVRRMEAIIQSMTVKERRNADIIDGSRRRRIAVGSGTSVQEVNSLLKQFNQAEKMVKGLKKNRFMRGGLKWQLS